MRTLAFAAAAVAALVAAKGITPVSGTFTATTVKGSSTKSCTTATGHMIATTKATYAGTSSGAPDLSGSATIAARSTIDTTDDVGIVSGTLKVGKTKSHFSAVYDHGSIAGLASGHGATPHTQLLANVSASFSPTTGFKGGKIGAGAAGGSAVEVELDACGPPPEPKQQTSAYGAVTASSPTSITVAGLTCAVPATLGGLVQINYRVGTRAKITCAVANGVETLVKITDH